MDDRFKVRIYDKKRDVMITEDNYYEESDNYTYEELWGSAVGFAIYGITDFLELYNKDKRFVVMQSTGLRDIKYKLIYEGDIVEILSKPKKVGVVVWRQNDCRYFVFKEYKFLIVLDIFLAVKVIGNIWENKELLEEQK